MVRHVRRHGGASAERKDGSAQSNAIIFHGTGADPEAVWYPWLGRRLDVTVAQAILVAGYCTQPNSSDEPVLQDCYD